MFFGPDFISVTKGDGEWQHLKPAILGAIMEHFVSGEAVTTGEPSGPRAPRGEFYAPEDEETVKTIKELLETRVRPAVAQDGGDITFQGYREGIVYLHMRGACSGCPSSTAHKVVRRMNIGSDRQTLKSFRTRRPHPGAICCFSNPFSIDTSLKLRFRVPKG